MKETLEKNTKIEQDIEPTEAPEETVSEMETVEKPYTFRTLSAEDVFPMFTIISKIGIKDFKSSLESEDFASVINAFSNKDDEAAVTNLGIAICLEIANVVLRNLEKCKDDIFKLLSATSDLSEEDVRKLSIAEFAEMIIDFVKKEEFADFFKVVSKLFK